MFDRYIQGTKPSWKRRAVLTGSLALHGLAVIVLVIYSFIRVEEIAPPVLSLTFFSAAPPPPPPPAPRKHSETRRVEKKMLSPTQIPTLAQPKQSEPEPAKPDTDGVEGGVAGGTPAAEVNREVAPAPKAEAPPPPASAARFEPPQLLTDEAERLPPYPSAALRSEIEGQVLLRVCVGTSGTIASVQVVKGIGFGCDEAAASWAKQHWKFRPAQRGGAPVTYCMMQPVRFQMQR